MPNGRKPDNKGNEEKKCNINDLSQDTLLHDLPPYLDPQSLGVMSTVSRGWHSLFSNENLWKTHLITHLGVKQEVLDQFEKLKHEYAGKISFQYKQMYGRYYRLKQINKKMKFGKDGLESMLSHENMQFFVLACCTNDNSLFKWIPRDLHFPFHLLSISLKSDVFEQHLDFESYSLRQVRLLFAFGLGFNNTSLVEKLFALDEQLYTENLGNSFISIDELNLAARSGNLAIIKILLALKDKEGQPRLIPSFETLDAAANSGNPALVEALLALKDGQGRPILIPSIQTLNAAARSGNLALVEYLLALKDEKGQPILIPDIDTLNAAARSGNLAIVQTLLALEDEKGQPRFIPNILTLNEATESGSLVLVEYLLALKDEKGQPRLIPNIHTLNGAKKSDNLALVEYLLALKDENGNPRFIRNINMLNDAVSSVMPEVLEILLALNDKNGWPPELLATTHILNEAARSGCLALVQTLLALKNEQGKPKLIPNIDTLDMAVESGNLALVQTLLALKNEKGQPRLAPNIMTLNIAVQSDNLALVQTLLALKNEKGQPRLAPRLGIETINYAKNSKNLALIHTLIRNGALTARNLPLYLEPDDKLLFDPLAQYVESYLEMQKAFGYIVDGRNISRAVDYFRYAYHSFSLYFFENLDDMLKCLTQSDRHENLIPLIHQIVADLIQTQLARTDLPLCEIEILKRKQNEFAPLIEPPTQHRKI